MRYKMVCLAAVCVQLALFVTCSPSNSTPAAKDSRPPTETPNPSQKKQVEKETVKGKSIEPGVNAGWTTFRGNPQRTGRSHLKGPRVPKLKWVFRTEGRIYADAAVAPDNTVYVASHDHRLYAVGPDGREQWSYDAGGKIWTSPSIAKDRTLYFGSDNDRLIALEPSGRLKWIFSTTQPPDRRERPPAGQWDVDTSPVVARDGTIIFGCHLYLYALRPSGILRWVFQAGTDRAKIFSSPALGHDGTIYFGTQGKFFFGLNSSAKVLWNQKTEGDNDSTPTIGDKGTVFFASDDGKVRAVAPGGNLKWETHLGAPVRAPLAIGHDNTVFASTFGREPFLAALDGTTGEEKWRYHIEPGQGSYYGIQSGALIDREGYVYFGARDHHIYCLSPKGALFWKYKTGDQVDSGPVLGPDGTLYIGSDDKRLYAFSE